MNFVSVLQRLPVKEIDEESSALTTKITELQRSPFAKTKPTAKLDEL